jgi:hypothetical protein
VRAAEFQDIFGEWKMVKEKKEQPVNSLLQQLPIKVERALAEADLLAITSAISEEELTQELREARTRILGERVRRQLEQEEAIARQRSRQS